MKNKMMKWLLATLMLWGALGGQAMASTRSLNGVVTEMNDDGFTLQVLWYAMGTYADQTWKQSYKTKLSDDACHVDGEPCDLAKFRASLKKGLRVALINGSRGTYYMNVITEAHLPVRSAATTLAAGDLVINLPGAVPVSQWGKKGVTAENWPFKPGNLQLHVSPDKTRAFGHITSSFAQAVEVDASGLSIDDKGVTGTVTATLRPTYGGEKQENRSYTFTLDGQLAGGTLTGTWKSNDGNGKMSGQIEATAPMGDEVMLWVIAARGLNPAKPEKTNTLVIPFKNGVAQKDGVRILHYKGVFQEGACESVDVTLKDGKVSGTVVYSGFKVTVDGVVVGSYAVLRCQGGDPLAESYAAGRLWPVHPKYPDLVPLGH